jgi:hypothetical protein
MSNSVVWPLNTFPASPSIPPPCFYNLNDGLAMWLNRNPSYKAYFIGYPRYFPYLYSQATVNEYVSSGVIPVSTIGVSYNVENVPLQPYVITLSQYQGQKYKEQFNLFLKVYAYNSNAYVNYMNKNTTNPIYYRFINYNEYNNYKAGVSLVNKAYPFDMMANGYNPNTGSTLNWIVPFPL